MKKILIADDRAPSRELIREILEIAGYDVAEAADGAEALDLARQISPDLILLDIEMPALNGFRVIEQLREDPRFSATPVVALTASAMQGDREKALQAGFTGYISKPVRLAALRAEVARLLR
jgi:two-component system, cell cycle response regulator DivK